MNSRTAPPRRELDRLKESSNLFYELIWPHAPMLLRVALSLCQNQADAEDLVQESLLKSFRHLDQFAEGTRVKSWLLTILRHTHIDHVRRAARHDDEASLESLPVQPAAREVAADPTDLWSDPQALLESLSDQELITALLGLPEDLRWTLLLVDVEGLEMRDAAGVMGIPAGTVKSRLHRGRGLLRQSLVPILARSGSPAPAA
jgi:RNA polymerase sigma-70 factor, ECF subfamily